MQYSDTVRDAGLDAKFAAIGASPLLKIRTGAMPANCAAADSGTVLANMGLPATWMDAASGGVIEKTGIWQDLNADASGVAAHFRIYDPSGTTCHLQGTVGTSAADMIVSTTTFVLGQAVTVATFTIRDNNG